MLRKATGGKTHYSTQLGLLAVAVVLVYQHHPIS